MADTQTPNTTHTRRTLLGAAAGAAAAAGTGSLAVDALAAKPHRGKHSNDEVLSFIATQEGFGVAFLSEAVRRAPGTPSAEFLPVLQAAVTAEFAHQTALERLGVKPLVDKYWIPDAAFGGGGAGLFASIAAVETIEVSMYLVGVTAFTEAGNSFRSRLCAEALGVEAEHKVAARTALGKLGASAEAPNNVGFEEFNQRNIASVRKGLEALGIGYGKQGSGPGRFYANPGNPVANGVGLPVRAPRPR